MDELENYKKFLPISIEVEAGKTYLWCSCGETDTPPLCSKQCSEAKALPYKATLTEDVVFCNCKHTKNPPWCDGSHAKFLLEIVKNRQLK